MKIKIEEYKKNFYTDKIFYIMYIRLDDGSLLRIELERSKYSDILKLGGAKYVSYNK